MPDKSNPGLVILQKLEKLGKDTSALTSQVYQVRTNGQLLEARVEKLEQMLEAFIAEIKEQMIELFSQVETASEMLEELVSVDDSEDETEEEETDDLELSLEDVNQELDTPEREIDESVFDGLDLDVLDETPLEQESEIDAAETSDN